MPGTEDDQSPARPDALHDGAGANSFARGRMVVWLRWLPLVLLALALAHRVSHELFVDASLVAIYYAVRAFIDPYVWMEVSAEELRYRGYFGVGVVTLRTGDVQSVRFIPVTNMALRSLYLHIKVLEITPKTGKIRLAIPRHGWSNSDAVFANLQAFLRKEEVDQTALARYFGPSRATP